MERSDLFLNNSETGQDRSTHGSLLIKSLLWEKGYLLNGFSVEEKFVKNPWVRKYEYLSVVEVESSYDPPKLKSEMKKVSEKGPKEGNMSADYRMCAAIPIRERFR